MPDLDSGCHDCFCKVEFVQTDGTCVHLCHGELHLSLKLSTYFSMLLVDDILWRVSTYVEYTIHAKNFSQDHLVFSYAITPMKKVPVSLT